MLPQSIKRDPLCSEAGDYDQHVLFDSDQWLHVFSLSSETCGRHFEGHSHIGTLSSRNGGNSVREPVPDLPSLLKLKVAAVADRVALSRRAVLRDLQREG